MEKNEYTYQSQVLKNEKGTQKSITHDAKIHSHQPHIYIPIKSSILQNNLLSEHFIDFCYSLKIAYSKLKNKITVKLFILSIFCLLLAKLAYRLDICHLYL